MTLRNLRLDCDRTLDLLIARGLDISDRDSDLLQTHLACCSSCCEQSLAINRAVSEMRGDVVYAQPAMVRATQLRVRARAAELERQQEMMRPLWIASALALVWALVSMPLLWQGFAWMGHTTHIPDLMWQTAFGFMALAPVTAVSAIGAAKFRQKAIA
jgi:predicted anti-sigma-YlaC factor YlaD